MKNQIFKILNSELNLKKIKFQNQIIIPEKKLELKFLNQNLPNQIFKTIIFRTIKKIQINF